MLASASTTLSGTRGPLHVAGPADLLARDRIVAIVGSRAASRAGRERAGALAHDLSRAGWLVISGGAIGIDTAAHEGALAAGAPTVAVVAGGVSSPYPARNAPLFEAILQAGGAIVSPFPDGAGIRRWHFVKRNHVIASLARAVVVAEAGALSGARHTAAAAQALGRLVAACPGSPGAAALIGNGAAIVERAGDLLAALAGRPRRQPSAAPPADSGAGRALAALDAGAPRSVTQVAQLAGLSLRQAAQELCALEIEGLASPAPGGAYLRVGGNGS